MSRAADPAPAPSRGGRFRLVVREQFRLGSTGGPRRGDHWAALRVGIGVAVPSLLLLAVGRPDLLIYVVFGAFAGMYGRAESHRARLLHQGCAAIVLVAGVAIGVLLSTGESLGISGTWALVGTETVFAGLVALGTGWAGLRPTGPFFGLFALGVCASVPLSVAGSTAVGLAAASALFSLVVGAAGLAIGRPWGSGFRPARVTQALSIDVAAYVVAVGAAGSVSAMAHVQHANWAMAAAAVPLAATGIAHRITRGLHRIVGTLLGIGVTALVLLPWGPLDPFGLGLLVAVLQFPTEYFMSRHYGLALVFFTPLILIMSCLAHPTPPGPLLANRAVETAGGAVIGMLVAVLSDRLAARKRPEAE